MISHFGGTKVDFVIKGKEEAKALSTTTTKSSDNEGKSSPSVLGKSTVSYFSISRDELPCLVPVLGTLSDVLTNGARKTKL